VPEWRIDEGLGLSKMVEDGWLIGGGLFCLGLLAGWGAHVLYRRSFNASRDGAAVLPDGDLNDVSEPQPDGAEPTDAAALSLIEAELSKAMELLEAADERDEAVVSEIETIDAAVKRANGRLKLLLKSVDGLRKER